MKKQIVYAMAALLLSSTLMIGCNTIKNANNTQKGAAIGAAGGAVLGGLIGSRVGKGGNAVLGAVIGAAIGGGTGTIIGRKMDKQAREISEALPSAEVERVGEGIRLVLKENAVRFDFDRATLSAQAKQNLDKIIPVFNDYPDTNIDIFGYTDIIGKEDYNLKLSKSRAESVKIYLASKGLAKERIRTTGLGIADPVASNETEEGRSQNRRVEFAITANEKMAEAARSEVKP